MFFLFFCFASIVDSKQDADLAKQLKAIEKVLDKKADLLGTMDDEALTSDNPEDYHAVTVSSQLSETHESLLRKSDVLSCLRKKTSDSHAVAEDISCLHAACMAVTDPAGLSMRIWEQIPKRAFNEALSMADFEAIREVLDLAGLLDVGLSLLIRLDLFPRQDVVALQNTLGNLAFIAVCKDAATHRTEAHKLATELISAGLEGAIKDDMEAMEVILRPRSMLAPASELRESLALVTGHKSKMSRPMTYFPVLVAAHTEVTTHIRKVSGDEQFVTKLQSLREDVSSMKGVAGRRMEHEDLTRFRNSFVAIETHTSSEFQHQCQLVMQEINDAIDSWIQDALASKDGEFDDLSSDVFQLLCRQSSTVITDEAAALVAVDGLAGSLANASRKIPTVEGTGLKNALKSEQLQRTQIVHLARMKFFDQLSTSLPFVMHTSSGLAATGGLSAHNAASLDKFLDAMKSDQAPVQFGSQTTNTSWQMCAGTLQNGLTIFYCGEVRQFVNDNNKQFVVSRPFLEPSTYQANPLVATDDATLTNIIDNFANNFANKARTKTTDFVAFFEKHDITSPLRVDATGPSFSAVHGYSMDNMFLASIAPLFWKVWVPLLQLHLNKDSLLQMESSSYDVKALAAKKSVLAEALP